jgi:hypothetical protein
VNSGEPVASEIRFPEQWTASPEAAVPLIAEAPAAKIARLVRERQFCAAARLYSEQTGADLIESKLAIDRLAHRHGFAPISGCASYFVMLLVSSAAGAFFLAKSLLAVL